MAVKSSNELYRRAQQLIPGGTQTISKRPERYVPDKWPAYWSEAKGPWIWDLDGNKYLDYVMALGPIILGYNHHSVNEAITVQLSKGSISSLQSPLEVALAEKLVQHIPSAEMVRFMKTGAEATAMAVRIARAHVGRPRVISCGYAGWHDWWVAKGSMGSSRGDASLRGVPRELDVLVSDLAYGDAASLNAMAAAGGTDVACIMIDTFEVNDGGAFLHLARKTADDIGALLVFDEIITGYRMGLAGAQGMYGVTPDLSTFGKAMANGMPISAVVGKREVMQVAADLWITSTFGGEALSLAAALATISELEKPATLDRLHDVSEWLERGFQQLAERHEGLECFGQLSMPGLRFTGPDASGRAAAFVAGMLEKGLLTRPNYAFFVTAALSDDEIAYTIEAAETVLAKAGAVTA